MAAELAMSIFIAVTGFMGTIYLFAQVPGCNWIGRNLSDLENDRFAMRESEWRRP